LVLLGEVACCRSYRRSELAASCGAWYRGSLDVGRVNTRVSGRDRTCTTSMHPSSIFQESKNPKFQDFTYDPMVTQV
jgi:hypothetical protein